MLSFWLINVVSGVSDVSDFINDRLVKWLGPDVRNRVTYSTKTLGREPRSTRREERLGTDKGQGRMETRPSKRFCGRRYGTSDKKTKDSRRNPKGIGEKKGNGKSTSWTNTGSSTCWNSWTEPWGGRTPEWWTCSNRRRPVLYWLVVPRIRGAGGVAPGLVSRDLKGPFSDLNLGGFTDGQCLPFL